MAVDRLAADRPATRLPARDDVVERLDAQVRERVRREGVDPQREADVVRRIAERRRHHQECRHGPPRPADLDRHPERGAGLREHPAVGPPEHDGIPVARRQPRIRENLLAKARVQGREADGAAPVAPRDLPDPPGAGGAPAVVEEKGPGRH